jgi:hypothetical protein
MATPYSRVISKIQRELLRPSLKMDGSTLEMWR